VSSHFSFRISSFAIPRVSLHVRLLLAAIAIMLGVGLSAPLASASIALVQHASKDGGVTSSTSLVFPSANTTGNWLAVAIRGGHANQVFAVSDSRGNVYHAAVQLNQTLDAPNGETLAIFYAENIAGGANTITVSQSIANNTLRFAILEYSGVASSNSLDVTASAQGSGTILNSGTTTTTAGGDLILGEATTADSVTYTAGSGFVIEETVPAAPNTKLIVEDAVQTAAGAVSAGVTLSKSDNGGALLAAFKAAGGIVPPSITSLNPNSGPAGASVNISGTNLGASQGTSTVTFNGTSAGTASGWSASSITILVPSGATTGSVVVTVGGVPSNGILFTIAPVITSLSPASGASGTSVTINGSGFGNTQGASTISFAGTAATPSFWSSTTIIVNVPQGAMSGNVTVTVGGFPSNSATFTVTPISVSVSPTTASVPTGSTAGFSANVQNDVRNASVTWSVSGAGCTGTACGTFGPTAAPSVGVYTAPSVVPVPPTVTLTATSVADPTKSAAATITVTQAIPVITSLSPTSGLAGASVTINGTNFGTSQGTSTVTFNGTAATPTSWSATNIAVPVPIGSSSGNVVVTVGGAASSGTPFTVLPSISSLSPTIGPVGTPITITGSGFGPTQGTSTVTFNGIAATPTSWSTTSIAVRVPAGATTGSVIVTVGGATSYSNNGVFIVQPNITSLSPASGTAGTVVTITGTTFGATQSSGSVTFNGAPASPTSWSDTSIVVAVPTGATTGNVVVTSGSASNGVPFTVNLPPPNITSLSPASGPIGASVTISGANFGFPQNASTVSFNGVTTTPTTWSANSIVARVPSGATTGNVVVTVEGIPSNTITFTVTAPPNISTLTPNSGLVGTMVTIAGTSFGATQGTSTVTFNGIAATPSNWSDTSITASVPAGASTGNVIVMVSGVASNGVPFAVSPAVPEITSLSPTFGPVGTSTTITGANFGANQGTSTVTFSGAPATVTNWSAGAIVATVPAGATTGNVLVTVGQASNGSNFTVTTPPAPIALVQHASKDAGTTTSSSLGFPSNNRAGNWIAVVIRAGKAGQVFTVSDTLHNTYRAAAQLNVTVDTPNGDTLGVFYAENIAGGANTITVSDTISSTLRFSIFEYSGVVTSSSLDATVANQGTTNSPNSGNVTTSVGGDLLMSAVMTANAATFTAGAGYKIEEFVPAEPNSKLMAEDQVQSVAGAASANTTLASSDHWGAILATFKSASGTSPASPTITSLNPTIGPVGTAVTITGTNFGASQGTSTVTFNGMSATPTNWSSSSISVAVPSNANTGNVVVTVGGVASNGVTFNVTPPVPMIASLNPGFAIAGGGTFVLTVNGSNFLPSSNVEWNGSTRTTSFVSGNQLQAVINSSDIAGVGTARVAVATPGLGGSVSATSTFLVGGTGGNNFAVISVNQAAQDIVYDPKNQVFYLSVPGTAANNPNTISVLDPSTGRITSSLPTGTNPNVLAISGDSQFLYAGIDGAASVQRFVLPGLTPDISYALGSGSFGPYFAMDLQVAPGAPHTTAVTLGNTRVSPAAQGGITIFDDSTPRPTIVNGLANLYDSLQWGANANSLFASNTESDSADLYTLSVNSGGVTLNMDYGWEFNPFKNRIHFDPVGNLIYADDGHAINPSTGLPVGNFNAAGRIVVDPTLNTAFVLNATLATIESFDLMHFKPISSIPAPTAGPVSHLIRWGQNGLAYIGQAPNGTGSVYLIGGDFVSAAPPFVTTPPPIPTMPPTPAPNAPTISTLMPSSAIAGGAAFVLNVTGTQFDPSATVQFNGSPLATTYVSSTQLQAAVSASEIAIPGTANIVVANPSATGGNSSSANFFIGTSGGISSAGTGFAVQIVNQSSKDIAFDAADSLIYVSVPTPNSFGNTIAVLDPATAQIVGEQYAGSNPGKITISDDGQFLYAGIDGSSSVQRFILPGLQKDISYPLGALTLAGPLFALDLQVAPGASHTTAVSTGVFNLSPIAKGGVTIFDDATARPTAANGFGSNGGTSLYDSLQWGSDTTALYAANNEDTGSDFYALSVSPTGVVLTNDYPNTFSSATNRIHFDPGTKFIYADEGHVVNPSTGQSVGQFAAFGRMVPDSTLNLAFFLSVANGSATIQSFDITNFAPVSSITIPGVTGNAIQLIRWRQNGLAFNTDSGQIVLVGGNFVH
jgi:hypothetical protein